MEQDGVIRSLTDRNIALQRQLRDASVLQTRVQDLASQNEALTNSTQQIVSKVGERDTTIEQMKEQSKIEERKRDGLKESVSKLFKEKQGLMAEVKSLKTALATDNGKF